MAKENLVESKPMVAIRKLALKYPEVEEGASCVNRAFKARKKAFVFMGMNESTYNVRLKLGDSLEEAEQLAEESPENYSVGAHGWTLLTFPHKQNPPKGLMKRWIDESFRLLAPKKLVDETPPPK
ncbi:MAG: MmcQ/YjbR family DNA-binding protein [Planctomycetaceae bacterium]|nr:MmcQ/YjbR family DNA-binding protein [Planctomycetaceae bacterium]MCB9953671.1 MmcQ/YjbR family DNA-binding protein [Planctomycetaceae bacterium]